MRNAHAPAFSRAPPCSPGTSRDRAPAWPRIPIARPCGRPRPTCASVPAVLLKGSHLEDSADDVMDLFMTAGVGIRPSAAARVRGTGCTLMRGRRGPVPGHDARGRLRRRCAVRASRPAGAGPVAATCWCWTTSALPAGVTGTGRPRTGSGGRTAPGNCMPASRTGGGAATAGSTWALHRTCRSHRRWQTTALKRSCMSGAAGASSLRNHDCDWAYRNC